MTTLYRIYGPTPRELLYVGITDHYDQRMRQHSEKAWWSDVQRITTEHFDDRSLAEEAERKAIILEGPSRNKAGNRNRPAAPVIPKAKSFKAPDPWLSQSEAADHLGVCEKTIRRYISLGHLKASRIVGSRQIRIRLSAVDALLKPIPTTGGDA